MNFLNYLKEPTIRKHMFGIMQITIGIFLCGYFIVKADTILMSSLFAFMGLSFMLGHRNIIYFEKKLEVLRFIHYMREKNKQKESRTQEDQEYINDYEKTDIFSEIFDNDVKEQ